MLLLCTWYPWTVRWERRKMYDKRRRRRQRRCRVEENSKICCWLHFFISFVSWKQILVQVRPTIMCVWRDTCSVRLATVGSRRMAIMETTEDKKLNGTQASMKWNEEFLPHGDSGQFQGTVIKSQMMKAKRPTYTVQEISSIFVNPKTRRTLQEYLERPEKRQRTISNKARRGRARNGAKKQEARRGKTKKISIHSFTQ